jgi:hypothetical protein
MVYISFIILNNTIDGGPNGCREGIHDYSAGIDSPGYYFPMVKTLGYYYLTASQYGVSCDRLNSCYLLFLL